MNDTSSSDTQSSGRGALAEFKEAVGGLINQVSGLIPGRGLFAEEFPRHELEIEDDGFSVSVELPGMKQQDVDVSVAGKRVTISGERQQAEPPEGARQLKRERPAGEFEVKIELPEEVDPIAVVARLEEGVLHVRLPKYKEARGRNIKVDATAAERRESDRGTEKKQSAQGEAASEEAGSGTGEPAPDTGE